MCGLKCDESLNHIPSYTLAQAAFRGQAQKLHPDHVTDPAKKAEATKQFQKLSEAYQTLRDPKKRRLYDQGSY